MLALASSAGSGYTHLGRDALWGLNADAGVPFPRRKNGDLIKELVDPRHQVVPVPRLVGHIMEDLTKS